MGKKRTHLQVPRPLAVRTMPLRLLLPKLDDLYKIVCLHCHFGELWQQQVLLVIQTVVAVLFTIGYQTKLMSVLSWYLYTSLILRNVSFRLLVWFKKLLSGIAFLQFALLAPSPLRHLHNLKKTWLYFILDRYFYYLLFYAMFLPLDKRWSVTQLFLRRNPPQVEPIFVNAGTVCCRGNVCGILVMEILIFPP